MTKKSNKVAALGTEYVKKKYAEFQQQQRQLIFQRRRLAAVFVDTLVIFAIISVQIFHDMQKIHQLDELRVEANIEMKEVNVDVGQLHRDVLLLKDDGYVTELARSKFLCPKDGERVYPILESSTGNSTNGIGQSTSSTTTK